jgi:hypothetical protein
MKNIFETSVKRWVAGIVALAMLIQTTGCGTIFNGRSQAVRIMTTPRDRTVSYERVKLKDGDVISVRKQFATPQFNVGTDRRPVLVDMQYNPDPWLIGDAALLLVFIVPGVVALGVDFGTGAWRDLDNPQHVYVPTAE